jgi:hypothetical protein
MCLFKNFPESKVVFKQKLNWFEKMLYQIDEKLDTQNFFIKLDGAYENNPKMHFIHAYQLKANLPLTIEYPSIYLSASEKRIFDQLKNPFVVLHLDTWSEKKYRQVYGINWEKIVEYLSSKNLDVIQIGKNPLHMPGTKYLEITTR